VSEDLLRAGGPLKRYVRQRRIKYALTVAIPKNSDGRVAHECPDGRCSPGYFKVKLGTGITSDQAEGVLPLLPPHSPAEDFRNKGADSLRPRT